MSDRSDIPELPEVGEPAEWLSQLLRMLRQTERGTELPVAGGTVESFRGRCRQVAETALTQLTVARLRSERERIGFVALPLQDYIEGMMRVLGLSLTRVLNWLGMTALPRLGEDSAEALSKLGVALGMSVREMLAHLRIGFACDRGCAPLPLLVARRRAGGGTGSPLEECEAVLAQLESRYDAAARAEWQSTEWAVRRAYHSAESAGSTETP